MTKLFYRFNKNKFTNVQNTRTNGFFSFFFIFFLNVINVYIYWVVHVHTGGPLFSLYITAPCNPEMYLVGTYKKNYKVFWRQVGKEKKLPPIIFSCLPRTHTYMYIISPRLHVCLELFSFKRNCKN